MVLLVWPAAAAPSRSHRSPSSATSAAQIEPPQIPLPLLPPSLGAVLGLVSPSVGVECGSVLTAMALVGPGIAGSLPVDPVPLAAPVVWACGAVPPPGKKLKCTLDQQDAALISKLLGPYAIVEAFVNPSVAEPVADQVVVLQGKLLANPPVDVAAIVAKGLTCSAEAAPASVPPPRAPTIDAPSTAPDQATPAPAAAPPTPSAAPAVEVTTPALPSGAGPVAAPAVTSPLVDGTPTPLALASTSGGHDNTDAGLLIGFVVLAAGGLIIALKLSHAGAST